MRPAPKIRRLRRRPRREEAGYVLMLVLALTVILLLGATAIYNSTDAHLAAFKQVRLQSYASANATKGAEDAISQIRSGQIVLANPSGLCPAYLAYCTATYTGWSGYDTSTPPNVLYTVTIWHQTIPLFNHVNVMVTSTGYGVVPAIAGSTVTNQLSARIDVQVQTQLPSTMGNNVSGGS